MNGQETPAGHPEPERLGLESRLRESEARYRGVIDQMVAGFALHEVILDPSGVPCDYRYLDMNPAFEAMTGLRRGDVIGRTVRELLPETEQSWIDSYGQVALTGQTVHFVNYSRELGKHFEVTAYSPAHGQFAVTFNDVSERKRADDALIWSRDFYLTLFEEFPALTWRAGLDAKCDYFSRAWRAFTGRTLDEERGDGWAEGVHPEDLERCVGIYLGHFAERLPFEMDYRLRRHDGEYRWITDFGRPLYDIDGAFAGYVGSCYDITERKREHEKLESQVSERTAELRQTVAELRERTARLRETVNDLNIFSASVSHDLRAPAREIEGFSAILLEEDLSESARRDFVRRINGAAQRMDRMVSDVLDYSRAARLEGEQEPVHLGRAVREVRQRLGSMIGERGAQVEVEVADDLPGIRANEVVLVRVIASLLDNAIRFVAEGVTPRVSVRAEARGQFVRLWVADNGVGIAPADQERVFAPFQRLRQIEGHSGSGLGLAIAKTGIERMDGSVGVESEPGRGSRFWIELPAAER